jgi:predicted DNA-binding transcriptional regulator AlpA
METTPRQGKAPEATAQSDGGYTDGPEYWDSLINEEEAGKFLKLSTRTMQSKRVYGGGPRYIRLSVRCIRYRRADLREWADRHLLRSTSDPGTGG